MTQTRSATVKDGAVRRPIPYPRGHQPQCGTRVEGKICNHPLSFHPSREDAEGNVTQVCTAVGCKCGHWSTAKKGAVLAH